MATSHFTAVVTITETTITPPPVPSRYDSTPPAAPKRETSEAFKVVVRADTIDAVADLIRAHVSVVARSNGGSE